MRFQFFSHRASLQAEQENLDEIERESLNSALHTLLESLPQSYSGRENVKLLCQAILGASKHLRFIWVGFCEGGAEAVEPYAAAGECMSECTDWRLARSCFMSTGAYSQSFKAAHAHRSGMLFLPWNANPELCSARSALAIPLRSESREMRGMIVFYADEGDYFSRTGVEIFQAFCHVTEIIWKQSNLMHLLTERGQQDALTGMMNRRHTMHTLEKAIEYSEREMTPLSILVCRLDGFKKLNDLYGWAAADTILAAFAKDLEVRMRAQDRGGRWTGTEFLYILPAMSGDEAEVLAAGLRDYFLMHPVSVGNWSVRLAVTVGVAAYSKHIIGIDDLIAHAHQSMHSSSDELPPPMQ
jgi:diguanylate cyclase (GGDEF)-like protein